MMAPGVSEETGLTLRAFLATLKDSPGLLAMIICNLALLAFIFYALSEAAKFRESMIDRVLANAEAIHQNTVNLQSRSVACPPYKLQSDESTPVELPELKPLENPK